VPDEGGDLAQLPHLGRREGVEDVAAYGFDVAWCGVLEVTEPCIGL
jgi:hypothetical protein